MPITKEIPKNIEGPISFILPDGSKSLIFNTIRDALEWFKENYPKGYSISYSEPSSTHYASEEIPIQITSNKGVDIYSGLNYNTNYNRASTNLGMNPFNWTSLIPTSYWNSDIHNSVKFGNDLVGVPASIALGLGLYGILPAALLGAANLYFAKEGYDRFTSPNGWRKTMSLFNSGDYVRAFRSGLGDALDVTMMAVPGMTAVRNFRPMITYKIDPLTEVADLLNANIKNTSLPNLPLLNIGWAPRLTLSVSHKSDTARKLLYLHLLGEDAIKMFKEYGGVKLPETGYEDILKYVPEARIKYGLLGDTRISDLEIAEALYKLAIEIGGDNPLLLFRGDTKSYTLLKPALSPLKVADAKGTMDNSLGNLFLGEFPYLLEGVDRYLGTWRNFRGNVSLRGSGTGSNVTFDGKSGNVIEGVYPANRGYLLYKYPTKYGDVEVWKLPPEYLESGTNDLNLFVPRNPKVRNSTNEISVLNDDYLGARNGFNGNSRQEVAAFYQKILDDAKELGLNLLKSDRAIPIEGRIRANHPLRDEHDIYTYYALPNWNLNGVKHILPYDLRIPRNWKDPNIFRVTIPFTIGTTGMSLSNKNE